MIADYSILLIFLLMELVFGVRILLCGDIKVSQASFNHI